MTDTYSVEPEITPPVEPPIPTDAPAEAEQARGAAAARTGRGTVRRTEQFGEQPDASIVRDRPVARDIPTLSGFEELEKFPPGSQYIARDDPNKTVRTKPFKVKSPQDWKSVPEGAPWLDPNNELKIKPVFEKVGSVLYNMAANDAERRRALQFSVPGSEIKQDPAGDLYAEKDGKRYKVAGFEESPVRSMAAGALPTAGAIAGDVLGGPAGSAIGGAFGQAFNDIFLMATGVYDRSAWEQTGELAKAGGAAAAGSVLGRTYAWMVAGSKATAEMGSRKAAATIANIALGTDPEGLRLGLSIVEQFPDARIPITPMFPKAPHLANLVEIFNEVHDLSHPLRKTAERIYEEGGAKVLAETGLTDTGSLLSPAAATPKKAAGEAILAKARGEAEAADAKVRELHQQAVDIASGKIPVAEGEKKARLESLKKAEEDLGKKITSFNDAAYKELADAADAAVKQSEAGRNSGELWKKISEAFLQLRRKFNVDAGEKYGRWKQQYGNLPADVTDTVVQEDAATLMRMLPKEFKMTKEGQELVGKLGDLGGVYDEAGELIKPPATTIPLGALHDLRTMLRQNVNWEDLRSDFINGAAKNVENRVNGILKSTDKDATSALEGVDTWYRTESAIYGDRRVQAIISGLKGGEPADPKVLFNTIIKEGRSDLNAKIRGMVGENLWAGVRAADIDDIFQASRTTVEGPPGSRTVDSARFIKQVMDRHRAGLLDQVHGPEVTKKLLRQVENLGMLRGTTPIDVRPGDGLIDVVTRLRDVQALIKQEAKTDPLNLLRKEVSAMKKDQVKTLADQKAARTEGPLGFLQNPKMGAEEAVNTILSKPDLIYAAEQTFGRESPEFTLIRQIYTQDYLIGERSMMALSTKLGRTAKEIQNIMWPGVKMDTMRELADQMKFMFARSKNIGASMMGGERVEHPLSGPFGPVGKLIPKVPVVSAPVDWAIRSMNQGFYNFIGYIWSRPALLNQLEKALGSGSKEEIKAAQEVIRGQIRKAANIGGAAGAGITEGQYQAPNE